MASCTRIPSPVHPSRIGHRTNCCPHRGWSEGPPRESGLPPEAAARSAAWANGQRRGGGPFGQAGRGLPFPPTAGPAGTSLQIRGSDMVLTSRASNESATPAGPLQARLPRAAMMTFAFASPPRSLSDLNRLLGAKVAGLLDGGGALAIYDVDTHKLIPPPLAVIVPPA